MSRLRLVRSFRSITGNKQIMNRFLTIRMRYGVCSALFLLMAGCSVPAYLDTDLPFEKRAEDLVSRMTLEEKVSQMTNDSRAIERLGVPAYNWWNECLHGVGRSGLATVFPQAIGMAAMWDDSTMFRIATAVSDEARAKYNDYASRGKRGLYQGLTFWTPNINIFRDPRWGRGMETYGEDPYLTGELGVQYIRGLQGDDPRYLKLVATAKHFAAHSGPESTRHSANIFPSNRDMAATYLPHFRKAVQQAGVWSVMCAYQRISGEPCCGNSAMSSLLRDQWGFGGYVVSDCWAVADFYQKNAHHVVPTREAAAAKAVKAGTDLNCGDSYPALTEAVRQGLITEPEIDVSVTRLMEARMRLGMFDPAKMVPYSDIPLSVVDCAEHRELALEAARKSMVLLENKGGMLPFTKQVRRVAVIGPNADEEEVLLANYCGYPSSAVTVAEGVRRKLPDAEVIYAQGCRLAEEMPHLSAIPAAAFYTDSTKREHGLHVVYFDNDSLAGTPCWQGVEPAVDHIWRTTPPHPGMRYDCFSARWSGVLSVSESGDYALGGEGYLGFELRLDGKRLASWKVPDQPHKEYSWVRLEAGRCYRIEAEYCQKDTEYAMMRLLWDYPKPDLQAEALRAAASSDLVILCMGLSPLLEGEALNIDVKGFSGGDRVDIGLPASQQKLIRAINKLGKPVVLVLLNGSAVAFGPDIQAMPAILEAWYPGQAGGDAVADVIFGDYNPAGRLPVTFYRSVDQIPAFENYDMAGKTYRYFAGDPLYPFGYGLSYTTFSYEWVSVPESVQAGEPMSVAVRVTNTGARAGDEVVQLYVALPDSKYSGPIRSLQGFKRICLQPGQSRCVTFELLPEQMAALDEYDLPVVEPGRIRLSVGGGQPLPEAVASQKVLLRDIPVSDGPYAL